MKICFVGSAESIHMYRWVRFFADRGHEVDWLSLVPSIFENMSGIRLQVIGGSGSSVLRLPRAIIEARRWIARHRPQIVHAHYLGGYGLIGAASASPVPFIATAWGSDVLMAGKSWVKSSFVRYILRQAKLVTCDAYHVAEAISELGIDRSKVRLVYFGIDANQFCPGPPDDDIRTSLQLGTAPTVISLRSLEPIYDVSTLMRASRIVLREIPEARIIVVGAGSEEDKLKDLSQSLDVSSGVIFVGRVPNHDLPRFLRSADVYVSTALSDGGLSASTAEAMACGLPVVVTDFAENGRWVQDGVNGYMFPVRDSQDLAHKLVGLLKDPELRRSLGRAGRQTVESRLSYQSEMSRMEVLCNHLLTYDSVATAMTDRSV